MWIVPCKVQCDTSGLVILNGMFEIPIENPDAESQIIELYSRRLIAFAKSRLADQMGRRVDAEDIVQPAYRSFFRRLQRGDFEFD